MQLDDTTREMNARARRDRARCARAVVALSLGALVVAANVGCGGAAWLFSGLGPDARDGGPETPRDSGSPIEDGGVQRDSGAPLVDAGPPTDAGSTPDGGPLVDAGLPPGDGGTPLPDGGMPWHLPNHPCRRAVVFPDNTNTATLTNFPVFLTLRSIDLACPGGSDLPTHVEFIDPTSGATLPFELEGQPPSEAWFWVRVPALAAASETRLWLYYGSSGVEQSPGSPWSDYAAVWHFAEPDLAMAADSSPSQLVANVSGGSSPMSTPGAFGDGVNFDAPGDGCLVVADPSSVLNVGGGSFSYSLWVRVQASYGQYDMPFFKGGSTSLEAGYDLELGTSTWEANLSNGIGNGSTGYLGDENGLLDSWHQLFVVVDRAAQRLRTYVDGAPTDTAVLSSAVLFATNVRASIGARCPSGGFSDPFSGDLDELRIQPRAVSADWVRTAYQQRSGSLYSLDAREVQ